VLVSVNLNRYFLFPAGLLGILCLAGFAWPQGGNLDQQAQGRQFLSSVSTESPYQTFTESPYQGLEASKGSARQKAKGINNKTAKVKNINQSPMGGRPKTDLRSPSLGENGASKAPSSSPKMAAMESAPVGKTYILSAGSAPTSFLDGYFLKSLKEPKLAGKRSRDEGESKDNFQLKNQKRNIRDNHLK
jgi:hypothetical protein